MSRTIPHDHSNIAQGGKLDPSEALRGGLAMTGGGSVVGGGGSGETDTDDQTAAEVPFTDASGWYAATDVEAALEEIAAKVVGYQAHGNMGATETFDAATGWHSGTFNANCTLTLTGATSGLGAEMVLELAQDGTGGWTITLPASVTNKAALEAAQVTTLSTTSLLLLMTRDGGTTWYGFWAGAGAAFASPTITLGTSASAGVATTVIRSDARIVAFDATVPVTQAFGDSAATGSVAFAARRDHVHGMPATPSTGGATDHEHIVNVVFSGDASATVWELPAAPVSDSSIAVYIAGSRSLAWVLSGTLLTTLTFDAAPASATNNIVVDIVAATA